MSVSRQAAVMTVSPGAAGKRLNRRYALIWTLPPVSGREA